MPPLSKDYLNFCFTFSLKQLLSIPTRATRKTGTHTDHVLTNSSLKLSQSEVIELGISDHDLVYCTRKTPSINPMTYLLGQLKTTYKTN